MSHSGTDIRGRKSDIKNSIQKIETKKQTITNVGASIARPLLFCNWKFEEIISNLLVENSRKLLIDNYHNHDIILLNLFYFIFLWNMFLNLNYFPKKQLFYRKEKNVF